MWLVVGLGNPGPRYAGTPHNLGFDVVDRLAARAGVSAWAASESALVTQAVVAGHRATLVKPQSFMNLSGPVVARLLGQTPLEGTPLERLLVVLDDAALEAGRVRIRRGGSDGGHRGLASVIGAVQDEAFPRVRLGVGAPPSRKLADHVLSPWPADAMIPIRAHVERATEAVSCVLAEGVDVAMNRYNAAVAEDDSER